MKSGRTLQEMAIELDRQQNQKRDFVADTRKLHMNPDSNVIEMQVGSNRESFAVNETAHQQLASWAGIPKAYYDKMPNSLRAVNANHWLQENPAPRMVRTLDGNVRAFLSDRYRTLDNFDLAEAVLPILAEVPEMKVVSCELTERKMYIKALFPRIEADVGVGDLVQSGVVISNSEIGHGSLRVEPLVYRLVCLNGMISNFSKRKYHVGKSGGADEFAREIMRDETLALTDKAFWMQVQDTVRASVNQIGFEKIVAEMRRTKNMEMSIEPMEVVERAAKHFSFRQDEQHSVLGHLMQSGDLNGFGLLNAITRTSQDITDYDRATDFERMGGQIIELSQSEWRNMAQAA